MSRRRRGRSRPALVEAPGDSDRHGDAERPPARQKMLRHEAKVTSHAPTVGAIIGATPSTSVSSEKMRAESWW